MSLIYREAIKRRQFSFTDITCGTCSEVECNSVKIVAGVMGMLIILIIGVAAVIMVLLVLKFRSKETAPTE